MIRFAVIADPHVHDCNWVPGGSGLDGAIRSFSETAASTRVFNESVPAFRAALQRAADAGMRVVLLVGDLTDDGQRPNIEAALAIIAEYRERYGLRVLATPGNHDFFGLAGRPQVKALLTPEGEPYWLDSAACPDAATVGTADGLAMMDGLGYRPEPGDLYWESPFGTDPAWDKRQYDVVSPDGGVACRMIDSSYLVEPVEGLWVLSIDANVCVPRDGASDLTDPTQFYDPTDGGWNAVLRHRRHLFPWMTDIARRAKEQGKTLVAFSHYPVVDALGGTSLRETGIFGMTGLSRRVPTAEASAAFAATGVKLHFSGHLHVNDTARHVSAAGSFVNIAMPSPVGYAPALKLVEHAADSVTIRSIPLDVVEGHDIAFRAYRAEAARDGKPAPSASLALDHGTFMDRHLGLLVQNRYLPREWPAELADFVRKGTMADMLRLLDANVALAEDFPLTIFVEDWYRLRKAGELARPYIGEQRLALYAALCSGIGAEQASPLAGQLADIVQIMGVYLSRPPNRDCMILLPEMAIMPAPADDAVPRLREKLGAG